MSIKIYVHIVLFTLFQVPLFTMVLAKLFQNFLDTMYLQIDSLGMLIVICVFLIMMQIALFTILLVFVSLLLILVSSYLPTSPFTVV